MEVAGKRAYFLFFFHFFCCTLRFSQHLPLGPGNALCGLSRRCPPCRNVNTLWIKPLGSCRTASLLCQQEPHPQWEFKKRKTEVYSIYHTVVSLTCPAEFFSFFFFFQIVFHDRLHYNILNIMPSAIQEILFVQIFEKSWHLLNV